MSRTAGRPRDRAASAPPVPPAPPASAASSAQQSATPAPFARGLGIGVDLMTVGELDALAERPWFTRFAFADEELDQAATMTGERRREFLAGRFAAKEAVLKAMGSGLFQGVVPRDIRLVRGPTGAPRVDLLATAGAAAEAVGFAQVTVSITHKAGMVAAVAAAW